MYKAIYFGGKELVFGSNVKLSRIKKIAEQNENIYQIVRNNHVGNILWERECK